MTVRKMQASGCKWAGSREPAYMLHGPTMSKRDADAACQKLIALRGFHVCPLLAPHRYLLRYLRIYVYATDLDLGVLVGAAQSTPRRRASSQAQPPRLHRGRADEGGSGVGRL
jgi:hypothetical protein